MADIPEVAAAVDSRTISKWIHELRPGYSPRIKHCNGQFPFSFDDLPLNYQSSLGIPQLVASSFRHQAA